MASMLRIAMLLPILLLILNISYAKPLCHSDERSALLQFKQNFRMDESVSIYPSSYPKFASWNNSNCCMWDGVECDEATGHVIVLDLSSSCLYGSFNSNSSLFYLSNLQRLNLGDNHFNFSQIPSKIASLSNLTYLNLSLSFFSGQIPMEISKLSELSCLDLHQKKKYGLDYYNITWNDHLSLADFGRLIQNLRKLEILDLSYINISSPLSDTFNNLSSLTNLKISGCNLIGAIPSSLGELTKLKFLDLAANKITGQPPSWLENLTELVELDLSGNSFSQGGFSWLGKQTKLKYLYLCNMNLVGEIPPCLKNLTHLQVLYLGANEIRSTIPTWLSNLTQLSSLDLRKNELHGPIPESISQCSSLIHLILPHNCLTGVLRFEIFTRMNHLTVLAISGNDLRLLTNLSANATLSKFEWLGLGDCRLGKFPDFIRHQNQLSILELQGNKIQGHIPKWIGNVGRKTLLILDLSHNSLSGFENPLAFSLLKKLAYINLSQNKFQGPLPSFPLSVRLFAISNNNFTGEISPWFCNLKSLVYFNLSNNNFDGIIPQCLGNSTESLVILSLANNHFSGNIPDTFGKGSKLRTIDLSHNQLNDRVPRSLANCKILESLDLSYNRIYDHFPVWLGSLPKLEILNLRSNCLFGALENPTTISQFPKLQILDLSHNEFTGVIPSGFLQSFNSMKGFDLDQLTYMHAIIELNVSGSPILYEHHPYQIAIANKGMQLKYWKIPNVLVVIDFSSNKFQGNIPESIGILKMINVLNLSNNHLSGNIPSLFRNLTNLESLDLSFNKFSGEIPQQLTDLTFLEYFNVSYNQLAGSIPLGKQFNTFDNASYLGNSELCGAPLAKKCRNPMASVQPHNGGSKVPVDVSWKSVAIGYESGIVVGVVTGLVFYERHQKGLLYAFRRRQNRRSRRLSGRRRGRRVVY